MKKRETRTDAGWRRYLRTSSLRECVRVPEVLERLFLQSSSLSLTLSLSVYSRATDTQSTFWRRRGERVVKKKTRGRHLVKKSSLSL